jgi:hypothetical protein
MNPEEKALSEIAQWYNSLPIRPTTGTAARGTIAAALVVLDRLKSNFDLDLDSHRAPGGSQISGVSRTAVSRILAEFGETRHFLSEGGRTNRGGPGDISKMLGALGKANLDRLKARQRTEIITILQSFLVEKVREFHGRQRLKFVYDPSQTTWQAILDLLRIARENGKEGPVAQYLVGAKLQLRFPEVEISNTSYSTADDPSGRPGDFYLGDTAFHITVAPMSGVYERCKRNIDEGLRAYLLVPERIVVAAKQTAEAIMPGRIVVQSIESFIGQNIEELSVFSKNQLIDGFRRLLESYNQRVDAIETDKSMLIEIPRNLRR